MQVVASGLSVTGSRGLWKNTVEWACRTERLETTLEGRQAKTDVDRKEDLRDQLWRLQGKGRSGQ